VDQSAPSTTKGAADLNKSQGCAVEEDGAPQGGRG
jgi:hypothetical protein